MPSALQTKPGRVLVKNIYYLLAYAFNALDLQDFKRLGTESFKDAEDLLAEILLIGVDSQRRRGFERSYKPMQEDGWRIKGRVDLRRSIRLKACGEPNVSYRFDEYEKDTLFNRILKASLIALARDNRVTISRRKRLRGALAYLQDVGLIEDLTRIHWSKLAYHRNNRSYEFLLNVCYLILTRRLADPSRADGTKLGAFDNEQRFSTLYEAFILNYYRRHFPQLHARGQSPIKPVSDAPDFVPTMYTDVQLSDERKTLIIDAKCYGRILQMNFDKQVLSAENVRQIFYYACHAGSPQSTSALLLYVGTDEDTLDETWLDNGYRLGCKTLDLNTEFKDIAGSLDSIVYRTFGEIPRSH